MKIYYYTFKFASTNCHSKAPIFCVHFFQLSQRNIFLVQTDFSPPPFPNFFNQYLSLTYLFFKSFYINEINVFINNEYMNFELKMFTNKIFTFFL